MKFTPPFPPGGRGSLRKMLEDIDAEEQELKNNPLYKEGYDDGYTAAQENYRKLHTALSAVYNIGDDYENT